MKGYPYKHLEDGNLARVILLGPGQPDDILHCSLQTISDWTQLEYYAISYAWGEPVFDVPVICDGLECYVTTNLGQALQRFRSDTEPVHVWADAICINQDDSAERSGQVMRMKDIFSQAKQVLIWLGPDDEVSPLVVRVLEAHQEKGGKRFAADAPEWAAVVKWLDRPWFWRVWTIQEARLAKSAIVYFGPYFVDLRIADKVMVLHMARDERSSRQEDAHLGYALYSPRLSVRLNMRLAFADDEGNLVFTGGVTGLLALFLSARRHQATDPRDKIFGLLGLAGVSLPSIFEDKLMAPDYTKSKARVYRHAATYLVQQTKSLKVLEAVDHGENLTLPNTMPSWVPRWDLPDGPLLLGEHTPRYDRSMTTEPSDLFAQFVGSQVLMVKTWLGAPIRALMPTMTTTSLHSKDTSGLPTTFDTLWRTLREAYGSPTYVNQQDLIMAFIQTLTISHNNEKQYVDAESFFSEIHSIWGHKLTERKSNAPDADELEGPPFRNERPYAHISKGSCSLCREPGEQGSATSLHSYITMSANCELLAGQSKDIHSFNYQIRKFLRSNRSTSGDSGSDFQSRCIDACNYRRLFITSDQHIGLGPQAMRVNDIVARIKGMDWPCILRRADAAEVSRRQDSSAAMRNETYYHFIGQCYVAGLKAPSITEGEGSSRIALI